MKKLMMSLCLCAIFLASGITLAACGEEPEPEKYTITLPTSSDYSVSSDKESAEAGEKITLTVTLLNQELNLGDILANDILCKDNYDGTYSFTMPAKNVTVRVETSQIEEVLTTSFVWLDEDNLYTITPNGEETFEWHTRNINITFADKQAMTIIKDTITSSNQTVIPDEATTFTPVTNNDLHDASGSNQIVKGIIEINPFQINPGTTYLTMEFINGNNSYGSSNRGTLIVKITVVPYGELTFETVKEELVIDLFSELDYKTGDKFYLRICDNDHIDGSSNPSYTDYILTMESIRKLTVEFDYIMGHKYWFRLVEGETYPEIEQGYKEEFIFENNVVDGDEESEYTGYYNGYLMYLEANDRVTIDAERNPALEN